MANTKATFTRAEIRSILGEAHTDEIENRLMALHLGVVDPLKDALQAAQNEANTAKNSGEYARLKREYDDYKAEIAGKETRAKKAEALREIAKDAGLTESGIAKAIKYADYEKLELDDKGALKNKNDVLKGLKEEWPEYVQTVKITGANTATPPVGAGSNPALKTKEEIYKKNEAGRFVYDAAQRQKMLGQNIAAQQQKG